MLKQGRLGFKLKPVVLKAFTPDKRLCVFHYMVEYLERTLDIRGKTKEVFLTTTKPHGPVSRDTISRWVRMVLIKAGIDVEAYKPGSTRAAATSKALKAGAPIDEILQAAGWSTENTFSK